MDFAALSSSLSRVVGPGDADPDDLLAMLRAEAPITQVPAPSGGPDVWFVTSYELARQCLADARLSFDPGNAAVPQHAPGHVPYILAKDPPLHTVLRQLVARSFSPGRVRQLRPAVTRICTDLVGKLAGQGTADLVSGYALPIPEAVAYELLGVPEADRLPAGRATELTFISAAREQYAGGPATDEIHAFVGRVFGQRGSARPESLTGMLSAAFERGAVSHDDAVGMLYLLFTTSQVSTGPFLAAAILRICERADQVPELLKAPGRWRAVVNEALRYDSAVQISMPRFALEDLRIGDVRVAKGEVVVVCNAAANRDPAHFAEPGEFLPSRKTEPSLAFGYGLHFCLGAPVARLEGEVALDTLFRALPCVRLAVPAESLSWTFGPIVRCLQALPVSLT